MNEIENINKSAIWQILTYSAGHTWGVSL